MTALAVLQQLASASDPGSSSPLAPVVAPWSVQDPTTESQPDGGTKISSALENSSTDETFALGSWELRLFNPNADGTGVEIPFHIFFDSTDTFQRIEIDLARFELAADPTVLTAAHLRTNPNTHLEAQFTSTGAPVPPKLLGPSFTLILSGETLDGIDVRFGGASGGAAGDDFPSLRFEPPHFLAGGPESDVGVVCDEVTLDLSTTANPQVVNEFLDPDAPAGTEVDGGIWQGLHLVELGVFIGDGSQVGTWSGMAAMRDFFIDFEGVLSGTFVAELVHHVVDSPQIVITITEEDGGETDDSDVALPAPTDGKDYRRVRLSARPSWSGTSPQAGLRPQWTVPDGVHVEEPRRRTSVDLGWARVPADGRAYEFTVEIRDHRLAIAAPTASRSVTVATPTSGAGSGLQLVVEGVPQVTASVPGTGSSQRLHMGLLPDQTAVITAIGRSANSATLTLTDPVLSISSGSPTQAFTDGRVQWTVAAAPGASVGATAVCIVEATDGTGSISRRLRVSIERALDKNAPDFELISYTDWRAEPGIGLARFGGFGGVDVEDIAWQLSSRPATTALFSNSTDDALFNGASSGWVDETIELANSAGTVRPFLHTDDRLWRLTGTVGATSTTTPGAILVGEDPNDPALQLNVVRSYAGTGLDLHGTGSSIRFHHDCDRILPDSGDCSPGVGVEPLDSGETPEQRFSRYTDEQVAGFIALYQALEQHLDNGVTEVGLFGFASAEGPPLYNADLADRRAASVETALKTPPAALVSAMTAAGYTLTNTARNAVAALSFHTASAGAQQSSPTPSDYPDDRRVFAIIKPAPIAAGVDVTRTEYFVTLPGAPNPTLTPDLPDPVLQEHPFRHAMFRRAYVEVELLRNELIRLQIQLKLDLEAFNENDLTPETELNPADGITTFFLELVIDDDPVADTTNYSWGLAALADPNDKDGFAVITDDAVLDLIGPPAITVPAITALVGGGRVDMVGFLAAVGLGAVLSATGVIDVKTLIWQGIRAGLQHSDSAIGGFSVALDYSLEYDVDVEIPVVGRFQTDEPIKLQFRNVGVEITHDPDGSPTWNAEFFYSPDDGFAIEIDDPGVFRAGDGLGRLLQVRRVAAGAGSPFWTEFEFGLAFDTGIVSLDTIRIRLAFDMDAFFTGGSIEDFSFSVNKVGASVDIPGAIKGSGLVELGESTVAGELDLSLIPLDLRVLAGFKFVSDPFDAFYGFLGVEFAPGIPIFSTGASLYGLHGLLGVNMGRTNDDALAWYKANPVGVQSVEKWEGDEGAWALGVGAVIGTVYDLGFTWNTKGTFLFELPGPKFTLATLSKILEPKGSVSESSISATIISIIMLDFENDIFLIALDFVFDKSPVITFRIPAELYFNMREADDWHVRFGEWEPASKRITMRILDLWNITGYLQIEGKELRNGELDLQGVAIGTGGRVDIFWGVKGVLYLSAYFEFHIGVQFDPFMLQGVAGVGGELQVGPISLSAKGELRLITPDPFVIQGEICGCISFFFFDVCGCADFEIGDGSAAAPPPKSPFERLALIDRLSSSVLTDDDGQPITTNIPIDTVLHVVFDQDVQDKRSAPAPGLTAPNLRNQVSNDLFFVFGLEDLTISPAVADPQQAWAPYSVKRSESDATIEDISAHADSNRTLRVFDWIPQAHGRALDFASGYGETLKALIERICEPIPEPNRGCGTFDEEAYGVDYLWVLEAEHIGAIRVLPLQFSGLGADMLAEAANYSRARVVPRIPVDYASRQAEERCLQLPIGPLKPATSLKALFPPLKDVPTVDRPDGFDELGVVDRPDLDSRLVRPAFELGDELIRDAETALEWTLERVVAAPLGALSDDPAVELPSLSEMIRRGPAIREVVDTVLSRGQARPTLRGDVIDGLRRSGTNPDLIESAFAGFDAEGTTLLESMSSAIVALAASNTLGERGSVQQNPFLRLLASLAGLVFVQLPPMVRIDANFVVPRDVHRPGEVVFLGSDFKPVSPVIEIAKSAVVPSSGFGVYQRHLVHTVRFGNPDPEDANPTAASWMLIYAPSAAITKPPFDRCSYLNEICGITLGEWRHRAEVADGRNRIRLELEKLTGVIGGLPAVSNVDLLEPATTYTVNLDMSWSRYQSATASEDDGTGTLPTASGTFRTAGSTPSSIDRYIAFTVPTNDRQPHYYEEPTEIVFLSKTADQMFEKYGQQLVARAKSALGSHTLLQPLSTTTDRFLPIDSLEETLLDALNSLDPGCTSADWEKLFPRPVLTFAEPLEPNTGYTVTLIPRPLGESSWPDNLDGDFADRKDVFRFDLTTSRWGSFGEHVAAYRSGLIGDLLSGPAADFTAAYGSLPVRSRSDNAVDGLNTALFGGPLRLADAPNIIRLWAEDSAPLGDFDLPTYEPVGVLLDGPEPLWKLGDGTDLLDIEVRSLTNAGDPFASGAAVTHKVVTGARGTRVYVLFGSSPIGAALALKLIYRPGPGQTEQVLEIPFGTEPDSFDEGGF